MLKGLEISEVRLKDIDLGDRLDAEYFSKQDLAMATALKKCGSEELRNFGEFVASAFYPAATELYDVGVVPFMRCVDCISYPVITHQQDNLVERIPAEFIASNKGVSSLNRGEIVITKVGTPCYASIVHEHESVALSRTVMGIANIKGINPYYLLAFLRSRYGFSQLMRQRELTIQYQLTLERVKRILVYNPSEAFQGKVKELVEQFIACERKAATQYHEAEQMLLDELGFAGWSPTDDAVSVKSYSDFVSAGRFDAEYFQPKYDELFAMLSRCKVRPLGSKDGLVDIQRSIEPGSDAYSDKGVPFVRIADFTEMGITPPEIHISPNICVDSPRPKKDTILLSKDGSVGIAYKVEEDLDVVTSSGILHLTVKDASVLPDYLTLVLNSKIVRLQAERDAGGSIIQHWKQSEIERVRIPLLALPRQRAIADKVKTSFALRAESNRLLDLAKHAVEVAIEQGEEKEKQALEKEIVHAN